MMNPYTWFAIVCIIVGTLGIMHLIYTSFIEEREVRDLVLCRLRIAPGHVLGRVLHAELLKYGYRISRPRFYEIMSRLEDDELVGCDVVFPDNRGLEWTYIALHQEEDIAT